MLSRQAVYVDTGAWIALALQRDALHSRAAATWHELMSSAAELHTSVPVILETFTFLERNTIRDVALAWKDSLKVVARLVVHPAIDEDLDHAWKWFEREDLYKLSAVDALSFVLMERAKLRAAFAFDHHFAMAGFRMIG